jgi:hypothetical protein
MYLEAPANGASALTPSEEDRRRVLNSDFLQRANGGSILVVSCCKPDSIQCGIKVIVSNSSSQ